MSRLTRVLQAATAALLLIPAAGCSALINEQATTNEYAGGDGISLDVGELELRNIMLVGKEVGSPANLLLVAVNDSSIEQSLSIEISGQDLSFDVPAESQLEVNPDADEEAQVDQLEAGPGALQDASFTSGSDTKDERIPVFNGALSQYAPYLPTASPTPTEEPTTEASDEPTSASTDEPTSGASDEPTDESSAEATSGSH
ncbi:hypothetical protein LWF01_01900 [Saxibacter everestensis]|uniref:DNA modification methylase n=1 Tax=Saxibacter everestensis TaxID=2909229 RepID=A0ABY8QU47_9MICO|nr:hypothetical protein LWF01_01900 [Brevibacteriaceae bacterium ZFBP1038]